MPIDVLAIKEPGRCHSCKVGCDAKSQWKGQFRTPEEQTFLNKTTYKPEKVAEYKETITSLQNQWIDVQPGTLKFKGWQYAPTPDLKLYSLEDDEMRFAEELKEKNYCTASDDKIQHLGLIKVYCSSCYPKIKYHYPFQKFPFGPIAQLERELKTDLDIMEDIIAFSQKKIPIASISVKERLEDIVKALKETQDDLCRDACMKLGEIANSTEQSSLAPGGKEFMKAKEHFTSLSN
jgi:hypothetical protein